MQMDSHESFAFASEVRNVIEEEGKKGRTFPLS